jgi:hypothetical protein
MQEYECTRCRTKFETTDSCGCSCSCEETKCPQCGSADVKKMEGFDKLRDFLKNLNFSGG